jgi:hypothetical protein
MKTSPKWKIAGTFGDVSPIEHGGGFVLADQTGVYSPEALRIEPPSDEIDLDDPAARWEVRRYALEPCFWSNGILSDNQFHKDKCAWFATTPEKMAARPQDGKGLADVASFLGMDEADLRDHFLSDDPGEREVAWSALGQFHGFDNLDAYPSQMERAEVESMIKGLEG